MRILLSLLYPYRSVFAVLLTVFLSCLSLFSVSRSLSLTLYLRLSFSLSQHLNLSTIYVYVYLSLSLSHSLFLLLYLKACLHKGMTEGVEISLFRDLLKTI